MLNFIMWEVRKIDFHQHYTYRSLTLTGTQVYVKTISITQKTGDYEKFFLICISAMTMLKLAMFSTA